MKWISALMLVLLTSSVYAKDSQLQGQSNTKWKAECSSCHIAYPAKFLTAKNWQSMMQTLDKHFGSNAEIEVADRKVITDFLKRHAGKGSRHQANSLRISDTSWFKREHREISTASWTSPAIKSPSNCTACHINGERGDWSERGVRMPKGVQYEEEDDDD